jgi:DNA-binding transcriptional LysR family regulator
MIRDELVAVMHATHPLAKNQRLTPEDLDRLPLALPTHRTAILSPMNTYFSELNVQPRNVIHYDDGLALQEIVKLSTLVTLLPRTAVRLDPQLVCVPLPSPGVEITLGVVATHVSPAVQAFVDVVKESVKYLAQE